jgi:hypothetical protein
MPSEPKHPHKIDRTIPLGRIGRVSKYPFASLGVGDSFEIRGADLVHSLRCAASQYARRHGVRFATRAVPGGVRVWRVA